MTRLVSLLAAAALLAACNTTKLSPDEALAALPAADAVQLGTPEAQVAAKASLEAGPLAPAATLQALAPVTRSQFELVSYWTAVTVNLGVLSTLVLVDAITHFPATSCEVDACTWGPWVADDGLNAWSLRVARQGDAFAWTLDARPVAGGAAATLLSGLAFPGADRHHGHGTLTIDFDAQVHLAHPAGWTQEDFGSVAVTYDNRGSTKVEATFLGAKDKNPADPHFMNARYLFDDAGAGGDFQVGLANLDTAETLALHTRWNAGAAGRGDAVFTNGAGRFSATQCWDGAAAGFEMTYSTIDPLVGTPDLCVFDLAAPTVEIP